MRGGVIIKNPEERCYFSRLGEQCSILADVGCDGKNKKCSWFKTKEQFNDERDNAIRINRLKGKCQNCRYVKVPCAFSDCGKAKVE